MSGRHGEPYKFHLNNSHIALKLGSGFNISRLLNLNLPIEWRMEKSDKHQEGGVNLSIGF